MFGIIGTEGSYVAPPDGEKWPSPWDPVPAQMQEQATLPVREHPDRRDARFRVQFRKSQLCKFYATGCSRGDACEWAHGLVDLQAAPDLTKTSLCSEWQAGRCYWSADQCTFAHGFDDLRVTGAYLKSAPCKMFAMGRCSLGKRCRHAHSFAEMRGAAVVAGRGAASCAPRQQQIAPQHLQHPQLKGAQLPPPPPPAAGLAEMLRVFPLPQESGGSGGAHTIIGNDEPERQRTPLRELAKRMTPFEPRPIAADAGARSFGCLGAPPPWLLFEPQDEALTDCASGVLAMSL